MNRVWPAFLLVLSGCVEQTEDVPAYRAAAAGLRDIVVAVESAGVIEPITLVEVKSKASGEILELAVETGERVAAEDLLAKIDQRVPRNTLAQTEAGRVVAHARLANAEAQLRRIQKLFEAASISEVDRETALLDVANAKAEVVRSEVELENARIAMDDTVVTAPISGTIIERLVERGQVISSPGQDVGGGTLLMRMADLARVRVRALVDETDIGKVEADMHAKVTVAAFPNRTFEGRVSKVEPQAAPVQNVTMFPVLVELDNAEGLLKPGMNTDVTLDIVRRDDVLAIPVAALRTQADAGEAAVLLGVDPEVVEQALAAAQAHAGTPRRSAARGEGPAEVHRLRPQDRARAGGSLRLAGRYVVFLDDTGGAVPRVIETGVTDLDYVEVVSGLAAGDRVLLLPSASLVRAQQGFRDRLMGRLSNPLGTRR